LYTVVNSNNASFVHSPYWAKLWPASLGLCQFLSATPILIQNKIIVEMAAGLGLPSLYAASLAHHVYVSDIEPQAVEMVKQSAAHNQLNNISSYVIDWNSPDFSIIPDTLLLSDINYEPGEFAKLLVMINFYLNKDVAVVLSTPQRLMAKSFINQLLPYCRQQAMYTIALENTFTDISVFVFRK
jgi:methyltransferase-like protein 23